MSEIEKRKQWVERKNEFVGACGEVAYNPWQISQAATRPLKIAALVCRVLGDKCRGAIPIRTSRAVGPTSKSAVRPNCRSADKGGNHLAGGFEWKCTTSLKEPVEGWRVARERRDRRGREARQEEET